jgi:predicted nicotinamide N-methyase
MSSNTTLESEDVSIGDFFICRDYTTHSYKFDTGSDSTVIQDIDTLDAASTDYDLTGQIVWIISVILSHYLVHRKGAFNDIKDNDVLELGAGVGLCGIIASQFARSVVISDYEDEVLKIIELNIQKHASPKCQSVSGFSLSWGDENDHLKLERKTGVSKWPVIVGADVVYWSNSVVPLIDTVSALLADDGVFILGYTSRVESILDSLLTYATEKGFQYSVVPWDSWLEEETFPEKYKFGIEKRTIFRFTKVRR